MNMTDTWGDGWNGNTYSIDDNNTGTNYGTGGLLSGSAGSDQVGIGAACAVYGCTDSTANNYDASANTDDGSCTYDVYGCTDPLACNYDSLANMDDGTCTYPVANADCNGCLPGFIDDGSGNCITAVGGCTDLHQLLMSGE
jgi:hypothetical protein